VIGDWKEIFSLHRRWFCRCPVGSSVTFEKGGKRAHFHRPHPERESLRYRVRAVREYLATLGIKP